MRKDLTTVIVGAGNIGERHAQALSRIEGINLLGFYDLSKEASQKMAEKYNARAFGDIEEILYDKKIDIVDICTPPAYHSDLALKSLENNKHVIIEKPLVLDISVIDKLEEIAASRNLKIGAISQHRFSKDAIKLKKLFEDVNQLKDIEGIDVKIQRSRNTTFTEKSDKNWKSNKNIIGGGVLLTIGIHYLDLLCWIFGSDFNISECSSDASKTEVESRIYGKFRLSGIPCEVNAQWGDCKNIADTIEVNMKNKKIIFRGDHLDANSENEKLDRFTLHSRQLEDFRDSILNDRKPLVTPADVKGSLKLVYSLYNKSYGNIKE